MLRHPMPQAARQRHERERGGGPHPAPLPDDAADPNLVRVLAQLHGQPVASITMPTHRAGSHEEDRIRLKNLLHATRIQLAATADARSAAAILDQLDDLIAHEGFWAQPQAGLAIYAAPGFLRHLRTPVALPELAVVGRHAHLKPLLPWAQDNGVFHLLELHHGGARLHAGDRLGLTPVALSAGIQSPARHDHERHSGVRSIHGAAGGHAGAIHFGFGAGAQEAVDEEAQRRFLRQVDADLRGCLPGPEALVVLAGDERLLDAFRALSGVRLVTGQLAGAGADSSLAGLHAAACALVAPHLSRHADDARVRYASLRGSQRACDDLATVLNAAVRGQVEHLFVAADRERWGGFDRASGACAEHGERQPGDEDLLNLALVHALGTHAQVHVLPGADLPGERGIAAILRY